MNKALIITRPRYDDTTHYLFNWSKEIIELAKRKQIAVIDLDGKRANREELISILSKRAPRLLVCNGHGNSDEIAGQDGKILLDADNARMLCDKIVYARACQSAKILGQKSVDLGCHAYLGYKEDFIFAYDPTKVSRPLEDKTAKLFLEPSNHVATSLIKGHAIGEADARSKNMFRKNMEKLLVAGSSSEDYYTLRYLYWDLKHQICLGDAEATL